MSEWNKDSISNFSIKLSRCDPGQQNHKRKKITGLVCSQDTVSWANWADWLTQSETSDGLFFTTTHQLSEYSCQLPRQKPNRQLLKQHQMTNIMLPICLGNTAWVTENNRSCYQQIETNVTQLRSLLVPNDTTNKRYWPTIHFRLDSSHDRSHWLTNEGRRERFVFDMTKNITTKKSPSSLMINWRHKTNRKAFATAN